MNKAEESIDTMQMVRAIRDKLSELRQASPAEYFRQIQASGMELLARRKSAKEQLTSNG
jgi:hypothetical protein